MIRILKCLGSLILIVLACSAITGLAENEEGNENS